MFWYNVTLLHKHFYATLVSDLFSAPHPDQDNGDNSVQSQSYAHELGHKSVTFDSRVGSGILAWTTDEKKYFGYMIPLLVTFHY